MLEIYLNLLIDLGNYWRCILFFNPWYIFQGLRVVCLLFADNVPLCFPVKKRHFGVMKWFRFKCIENTGKKICQMFVENKSKQKNAWRIMIHVICMTYITMMKFQQPPQNSLKYFSNTIQVHSKHQSFSRTTITVKMSGFTSIFGSSGASKTDSAAALPAPSASSSEIKKQIQEKVSQELAIANATELVNKITENCFEKCILTPGSALSSTEQACTKQCMDKYMAAWNTVSRAYISRIQQASTQGF